MKISKKGFTAFELVIFIIVLGALAFFGINKYRNTLNESRTLELAGIMYYAMANTDLYIIRHGIPKKAVQFTGYEKDFIGGELPGDCSVTAGTCQTEHWEYESSCQKNICVIMIRNRGWLPGGDIALTLDTRKRNNQYKIAQVGNGTFSTLKYLCPLLKQKKIYFNSPLAMEACEKY